MLKSAVRFVTSFALVFALQLPGLMPLQNAAALADCRAVIVGSSKGQAICTTAREGKQWRVILTCKKAFSKKTIVYLGDWKSKGTSEAQCQGLLWTAQAVDKEFRYLS